MCSEKKQTGKKAEKEYKGVKPTKALSAYIYFSNEMVPKLKEKHGISHQEAMKKAGEQWQALSAADRKPYEEQHAKD